MVTHHGPLLETGTTRAFKGHASPMSITQVINLKEIKECLHGVSKSKKKSHLNIASEASNVYILKPQACGQTVLPDNLYLTKIGVKYKN